MPWTELQDPQSYRLAVYHDPHGIEVGVVVQFYEDGPTYPAVYGNRLGPHSTWDAAVRAVENGDRVAAAQRAV